jgi:hypothetical protein
MIGIAQMKAGPPIARVAPRDQQGAGGGPLEGDGEERSGKEAERALESRLYAELPQVLAVAEFAGLRGTHGRVVSQCGLRRSAWLRLDRMLEAEFE